MRFHDLLFLLCRFGGEEEGSEGVEVVEFCVLAFVGEDGRAV